MRAATRLAGYGVELERLGDHHVEQTWRWRSDPEIRRWMVYQDPIELEDHRRWYAGLDPERDHYFVLYRAGEGRGVLNLKDVDDAAGTAEWGVYVARPEDRTGLVAVAGSLLLLDYAFEDLALTTVFATIRLDNPAAISFNESLGFRAAPPGDGTNVRYAADRAAYERATAAVRALLLRKAGRSSGAATASRGGRRR